MEHDYAEGNINAEKGGVLCFPFLYNDNWKAEVNGCEAVVEKVNVGFCGIKIQQGENHIRIYYDYFWNELGLAVFLVSICVIFVGMVWNKKYGAVIKHGGKTGNCENDDA